LLGEKKVAVENEDNLIYTALSPAVPVLAIQGHRGCLATSALLVSNKRNKYTSYDYNLKLVKPAFDYT
jgi:hypothetical protein